MKELNNGFLTDAQLKAEIEKCEYCAEKPCKDACPADCSPADFIMAVRLGARSDYRRSAALIMGANPLGGVCGAVCPDRHCMKACVHRTFDSAVNIPAVQATIIERAKTLGVMPDFPRPALNGRSVAILGSGPSGLGAAALLAQLGYKVDIFDRMKIPGGMCTLIPESRLSPKILKTDIDFLLSLGKISIKNTRWSQVKTSRYDAVLLATGLDEPFTPEITGGRMAVDWMSFLAAPGKLSVKGKRVAIVGGGAVALDCAEQAMAHHALSTELFALEKWSEMPLTAKERSAVATSGITVSGRVRVTEIYHQGKNMTGLKTIKVTLPDGKKFHPKNMVDLTGTEQIRPDVDFVILAAGAR